MNSLAYTLLRYIRRQFWRAFRRWQREQRRRSRQEQELQLAVSVGRYVLNKDYAR